MNKLITLLLATLSFSAIAVETYKEFDHIGNCMQMTAAIIKQVNGTNVYAAQYNTNRPNFEWRTMTSFDDQNYHYAISCGEYEGSIRKTDISAYTAKLESNKQKNEAAAAALLK